MEEGKKMIILGIVFLAIAMIFYITSKQLSIWTILLIILSIFDLSYGIYKLKK